MNVYRAKSGQLWFEVARTQTHISLHAELRTGWEMGPTELLLTEFHSLGYILVYAGEEGLAIARERIGNLLLRDTNPLATRSRSPWDR